MSKNNREYWTARALKREQESYVRGSRRTVKLFQEYQQAASAIRREVNDFYMRYAGKYGLSYEKAVRLLNLREMQEWQMSIGDYVARIASEPDPRIKVLLTAELDALSYNSSITRLDALNGQIDIILNELYDKAVIELREEFGMEVVESYYKKLYDLQVRSGLINEIAKITPHMVEDIISYPWSGAMFSDRLWRNKQAMVFHLRETLAQGIIRGKSLPVMSREMAARMGKSFKNAERLIRTETNYFHNAAEIVAYKAAGVEEYEFMATLDNRTSAVCGNLDGQHFKLSDAKVWTNFPPMHPNCRSTTIEYDPEDALDWAESGEVMPENMTHKKWKKNQENGTLNEQHLESVLITDETINNVPMVDLPEYDKEISKKMQKAHTELLQVVKNKPVGYEYGRTFSLQMGNIELLPGKLSSVNIPDYDFPYIAIHNHPSGGSFSVGDLRQFILRDNLRVLSVVGNDGDVFILTKTSKFDGDAMDKALEVLKQSLRWLEKDKNLFGYVEELDKFLKGVDKYGAGYYTKAT